MHARRTNSCMFIGQMSLESTGSKVKCTLANLSKLPPQALEALRRSLQGDALVSAKDAFEIVEGGSRFH